MSYSTSVKLVDVEVFDIRFPTSFSGDGSDSVHWDPDYSACYVRLKTDEKKPAPIDSTEVEYFTGCGLTFTIGRGNELVKHAVDSLRFLVIGRFIEDIQGDMSGWVQDLSNDSQLRWVGPEKGVVALASAAIINAFWDLWAKLDNKPVWKLLVDMKPKKLVSLINFKYIEDYLSPEDAVAILEKGFPHRKDREDKVQLNGFPAYTTQVGWIGYTDFRISELCKKFKKEGFNAFKVKVGNNVDDDKRRLKIVRDSIGQKCKLMVDANQKWGVKEAIKWMEQLAPYDITWIEEPTSPDDVIGHQKISKALEKQGIGVATGEMCQNRVMFKQFLQSGGMQFCQIDAARMPGGLNDAIAVYLLATKAKVPVSPHAGGVGLCEMVQHLQVFDYIALSGTSENRMIEYIDHLHEHFKYPPKVVKARYFPPADHGYSTEMKRQSILDYEYPNGIRWKEFFKKGKYSDPSLECKRLK